MFLPALPPALNGYRVAVVADLHITRQRPFHAAILTAVRNARPDLILIAGDSVDSGTTLVPMLTPFFETLARMAPAVAVLGNNDCLPAHVDAVRDVYARAGVTLLEDETRLLDARGYPMQITGLIDPYAAKVGIEPIHRQRAVTPERYVPLAGVLPPRAEEKEDTLVPSILLLHQPQLAPAYAELRPSLIVAGHAHGGQFRLPHGGGLFAPGQGFFPRYTNGLYPIGSAQLLVSRGLGNHDIPLRLGNRPHLPIAVFRR